ncbi:Nramp family divalent metal transporter [Psychroserpens luteolus]|uniref:Nramp family divalent metal transporter n=1 Tax=Psychroserpens luteolus TaxID=2855840 RepID=UPI001E568206|nr:Nramp family divalent metal transporter [Psychroserpens luteolus]MCD2260267.1 Nramp family divalent metal transporter [Psychroserpens luteolus]
MSFSLKKIGPGLLFAGAAIGVSHLVQSTRAGADFGFGLIWALLLVNIFKYPFFQFGPRYAMATGETLLDGYKKLGKGVLIAYFILTIATMFTIQTAVTIVTAGLAESIFGDFISTKIWTVIILSICFVILIIGKYSFLDKLMKFIIVTLTLSTIVAVCFAFKNSTQPTALTQVFPNAMQFGFLIAFMGWMPAPLDISVWHSLWAIEKKKEDTDFSVKSSLFDFNVGYFATIILGLGFLALGALVMFNSGENFSGKADVFSNQLISMYTKSLGNWSYLIIGIAAFTTMFSTTLTTLDASPRAMVKTTQLLFGNQMKRSYLVWILILISGTILIFFKFKSDMALLITIATVLSFITAPLYAIANYVLISSRHTPKEWRPSTGIHILSWLGLLFLVGFSIWYIALNKDMFIQFYDWLTQLL